jgi:hypothetical protein
MPWGGKIAALVLCPVSKIGVLRRKGDHMNIRKNIDYRELFGAVDAALTENLSQMELYREIGRLVSQRPEKGAAVAVAEYLTTRYPDVSGFFPRNLRRMRDFYRTYESAPELLELAMNIGWTQNVVILEADLTLEERGWSKPTPIGECREFFLNRVCFDLG